VNARRELDALMIRLGRAAIACSRVPIAQDILTHEARVAKELILHEVTVLAIARALAGGRE
jgi:hypothetical protein